MIISGTVHQDTNSAHTLSRGNTCKDQHNRPQYIPGPPHSLRRTKPEPTPPQPPLPFFDTQSCSNPSLATLSCRLRFRHTELAVVTHLRAHFFCVTLLHLSLSDLAVSPISPSSNFNQLRILCASPQAIAVARATCACVVDTFWATSHVLLGLFLQTSPPRYLHRWQAEEP